MTLQMGSLLYHLDNHHQEITHGGKPDLDYYGVRGSPTRAASGFIRSFRPC